MESPEHFMASPEKAQKDRAMAIYAELQTFLYQVLQHA